MQAEKKKEFKEQAKEDPSVQEPTIPISGRLDKVRELVSIVLHSKQSYSAKDRVVKLAWAFDKLDRSTNLLYYCEHEGNRKVCSYNQELKVVRRKLQDKIQSNTVTVKDLEKFTEALPNWLKD